jgi:hypothetical protein
MKFMLIIKTKYATIEKPCNNIKEAIEYTKKIDDIQSYEIKTIITEEQSFQILDA